MMQDILHPHRLYEETPMMQNIKHSLTPKTT